jgi:hypothetical protein
MASLARARRGSSPFRASAPAPREISLVGSAMGTAVAGDGPRCIHCHRTPLVGEVAHVYGAGSRRGEELVCELCRPLRAAEPDRSMLVRSAEAGSVRPVAPRP